MYQLSFEADEGGSSKSYLIPVFEQGLMDADTEVRQTCVLALPAFESPLGLSGLVRSLDHQDNHVRYYAACGLRKLSLRLPEVKSEAVASLRRALARTQESDHDVRLAVAHALTSLGELQDGSVFIEALRRDEANWALASEGLAMLRRKDAITLMIRRMRSREFNPRYLADALQKLTGQSFGVDAEAWTEWYRSESTRLPPQVD